MAKQTKTKTTALARRQPDYQGSLDKLARQVARLASVRSTAVEVLPAAPALAPVELTENPILGQLGLQPLTLSAEAEAILNEPIDEGKVLIKPTGAVYYPHIEYTRWFNRGFGRGAWTMVPAARPKLIPAKGDDSRQLATQTFVLFVHGKPVAQATGEQEYHEDNNEQTYADVIEALNANALRRVAKRLGIGLELWDRSWGQAWQAKHAIRVWVENSSKPVWRRKVDPPFWNETGPATEDRTRRQQQRGGERSTAQQERDAKDERLISDAQVKRFWAIARKAKRTDDEIKGYLRIVCGVEHTKDIKRMHYDKAVEALTKAGPMVEVEEREPGAEG